MSARTSEQNRIACAKYRARVRAGLNGTGSPTRRLTLADAVEILRMHAAGWSTYHIADLYPVSVESIRRICIGETYKDAQDMAAKKRAA